MKKTSITKLTEFMSKPVNPINDEIKFDENDPDIIDVADTSDLVDMTITKVTPMTLSSNNINGKDIATIFYLCNGVNEEDIFVIYHNYFVEDETDDQLVKMNLIHDSQNFLSKMVAANMIVKAVDNYGTDLKFYYDREEDKYSLLAINSKEEDKIFKFTMNADIFASMAFMDDAICSANFDEHDFITSVGAGAFILTSASTTFIPDTIESVISLAMADKESNTLAVVFKALKYKEDGSDTIKILMPVCVEERFKKNKFNTTVEDIGKNYTTDADQYVLDFMFDVFVGKEDKQYLALRVTNCQNTHKVVLLDTDNQEKLSDLISKF